MSDVSIPVIILNWNGIDDTIECISSLSRQSFKKFHVYLIDNNSTDGSQETLLDLYSQTSWIKLIFNEKNIGFTKGNNRIMSKILQEEKPPPYIILLNNDTIQKEDWIENIIKSARDNKAHVVSSKMIDYYNRDIMDNAGHFMLNTGEIISIGHQEPVNNFNESFENIGACGGAALYSTSMLIEIGVFDEYFDTGYEDAELGLRAYILGYKCWYEPKAIVFHKMGQSIKKVFNENYVHKIHRSIWYTYFKLMPITIMVITLPSFLFKYFCMLIINLVFAKRYFLKLMLIPLYKVLKQDIGLLKTKRRDVFNNHKSISHFKILKRQTFFLAFDIKRFISYYILRNRKIFEKYN